MWFFPPRVRLAEHEKFVVFPCPLGVSEIRFPVRMGDTKDLKVFLFFPGLKQIWNDRGQTKNLSKKIVPQMRRDRFFPKQVYLWGSILEKKRLDTLVGALCCVGRGFGRAGRAGPGWAQIWLCLARSAGLGVLGALGWVGRRVWLWWGRWAGLIWPCWACWAGLGVGFGFGRRADFARVGRRFGFAWRAQLGVGFGRAGRVGLGWAWGLALGCVGRGIWPCWARWAGVWLWWARWADIVHVFFMSS